MAEKVYVVRAKFEKKSLAKDQTIFKLNEELQRLKCDFDRKLSEIDKALAIKTVAYEQKISQLEEALRKQSFVTK